MVQATIPAKLRGGLYLDEGDLMEAIFVGDCIDVHPEAVVDGNASADRIVSILAGTELSPEDFDRSG